MGSNSIKVFIALDIPIHNDQQQRLEFMVIQEKLQKIISSFRPYSTFHSTIAFIGFITEEQLPIIKYVCQKTAHQFRESKKDAGISNLSIGNGLALFGKNAIGLTIAGNDSVFQTLITLLHKNLAVASIAFDNKNQQLPLHITLGRFNEKEVNKTRLTDILSQIINPESMHAMYQQTFTIKTMTLYQSLPGSKYNPLEIYEI